MPKGLKHNRIKMFLYSGEFPEKDDFKIGMYPIKFYMEN